MGLGKLKRAPARRVIGVDASTQSFAFCIYDEAPIKWGEIYFEGSNVFARLADANRKLNALKDEFDFDLIVIEAATMIQNRKTVILLAYSFGSVLSALMKSDERVEEMPPVVWQRAIGNNPFTKEEKAAVAKDFPDKSKSWYTNKHRELRKQRTIDWVDKTFGIKVESDNVADAIGISHVGYKKYCQ